MVHDLRILLSETTVRPPQPRAVILDSRALQSTPESGGRDGYDGHKRHNGATMHLAVGTVGQLLAMLVTLANEQG